MRTFGARGAVQSDRHYIVPRTEEVKDFINRVKDGRYIVLFAPRQTGKTTFFRLALATLAAEDPTYFPIQLSFDIYKNFSVPDFYELLYKRIRKHIENVFQKRGHVLSEALTQLLDNTEFSHHGSMLEFFTQLNYDRSISPFNIQDEFHLPNFTLEQVRDLFGQYTDEAGQPFAPEVIVAIHRQTAGQPFLVNRFGQILTTELDIPKIETITMGHFAQAHKQLLGERSTNISKNPRFETLLMKIISYERGIRFNSDNEIMNELATYGVIRSGADGMCEIVNPIYLQCIMQTFQPFKYRQF